MVVDPSAAKAPERTSLDSTARPALTVHWVRSPDSNPSLNSGGSADGVATSTEGHSADRLAAPSTARTA